MPWIKVRISPFVWLKCEDGPPPSCRILFLNVSWFDWDTWSDKMERALKAAREELRK